MLLLAPLVCAQKWKPVNASFDSLMMECESALLKVNPNSHDLKGKVDLMLKISSESDDNRLKWRALYWKAKYESLLPDSEKGLLTINDALSLVDSVNYPYDYHRMIFLKFGRLENYDMIRMYVNARNSVKYFRSIKDPLLEAEAYALLARALSNLNLLDKSLSNLKIAINLYHKYGEEEAIASLETSNLGLYVELGDSSNVKALYQKLSHYPPLLNDSALSVVFYTNVGAAGIDSTAFRKAYDIAVAMGDRGRIYYTASNLAYHTYWNGDPQKAIELFRQALGNMSYGGINQSRFKLSVLGGLSQCYESIGEVDSAFVYLQKYILARDSIDHINSTANFQEAYERQALEREEERVAYEQSRARNRLLVTVLVFALILIAAIFAYNRQRLRRKLKEAENKELEAQVKAEQLQKELYQQRSEDSERELTTSSLLLIEKKKMIDNLTSRIEQHGTEGHIDRTAKRDLQNLISMHQGTEESLEKFYDYFNQLHPDFFSGLKERYPSLTKGDLRLCAYIRMGLDTKQIAQMLSVDPGSIKKARYRMRSKMGMATSESLDDLLMMFPSSQTSKENTESEGDTPK